jgi:hypothetical protein
MWHRLRGLLYTACLSSVRYFADLYGEIHEIANFISGSRPGDDEGTIEFDVVQGDQTLVDVILLVPGQYSRDLGFCQCHQCRLKAD